VAHLSLHSVRGQFRKYDQGITGAIVDTMAEGEDASASNALDRRAVRRRFEQRFSSTRMATNYVALYRSLLKRLSIFEHGFRDDRVRRAPEPLSNFEWGRAI
jgi:hypothetical protein